MICIYYDSRFTLKLNIINYLMTVSIYYIILSVFLLQSGDDDVAVWLKTTKQNRLPEHLPHSEDQWMRAYCSRDAKSFSSNHRENILSVCQCLFAITSATAVLRYLRQPQQHHQVGFILYRNGGKQFQCSIIQLIHWWFFCTLISKINV